MKKLTAFLILAALSISLTSAYAQEGERQGRRGRSRGGQQQAQQASAATLEEWASIQSQLKKEFPKKYEEIEKLQKTNVFAAFEKLRELAREADIQTPSTFNRRGFGGGGRPGGFSGPGRGEGRWTGGPRGDSRNSVEAKLKQDFAAEYAEITKLRIEAENKLEELAKKAKVTLPGDLNSYRLKIEALRLEGKYKAEFEEIDKLMKTDMRAALAKTQEIAKKEGIEMPSFGRGGWGGGRGGGAGENAPGGRVNPLQKIMEVRKKYPEEMKKLEETRRENPRAYREGLRKLIEKYDSEQNKK